MINLDLKQQFIERARALSQEPEILRSTLMTALIAESIGFGVAAEGEYFEAAYGDSLGRAYWGAHLSEPMRVGKFAYLLSAHLPVAADQLEGAKIAITLALRDAAEAGERLFVGGIAPLLAFEHPEGDFGALIDVKVRPRRAVEWLLSNPRREHLIPLSLRTFLGGPAESTRRPLKRNTANQFVAEFIATEKAAGREPNLKSLEAKSRASGFTGGREFLREAFHRSIEVRRGRFPKNRQK